MNVYSNRQSALSPGNPPPAGTLGSARIAAIAASGSSTHSCNRSSRNKSALSVPSHPIASVDCEKLVAQAVIFRADGCPTMNRRAPNDFMSSDCPVYAPEESGSINRSDRTFTPISRTVCANRARASRSSSLLACSNAEAFAFQASSACSCASAARAAEAAEFCCAFAELAIAKPAKIAAPQVPIAETNAIHKAAASMPRTLSVVTR